MKMSVVSRIDEGILVGTEIESVLGFLSVKYPHRNSKDLYVPPMKTDTKEVKTWHCCQPNCKTPDFEGGLEKLLAHLMLHKGRLVKPWSKKNQLKSPMPAVKLPPNPWDGKHGGCCDDRQFVTQLYIDDVKRLLHKQGIETY